MVREASNVHLTKMRSGSLIRCLSDAAVVVDFHRFTDCHLEAIFNMNNVTNSATLFYHRRWKRCSSDHRRFSLNPVQRDILPDRYSQLSDLTIKLYTTTSLKSISQKRWLYHQMFKRSSDQWPHSDIESGYLNPISMWHYLRLYLGY